MDDLVVFLMGVFIANYKTDAHPYLTSFVKAFLIVLLGMTWFMGRDFVENGFNFSNFKKGLLAGTVLWLVLSVFFSIVELVFKGRKS